MLETHVLVLGDDGLPKLKPGEILELPIPYEEYRLRIVIPGTSPVLDKTKAVECNVPRAGGEYDRSKFHSYPIDSRRMTQDVTVDVVITHGGSYTVRIGSEVEFNFVVGQGFTLHGTQLTGNSLCIQTVLSKLVDPGKSVRTQRWREVLEAVAYKRYNMIHFVPLQPRGESGSPFSILDQLKWDPEQFPDGEKDVEYLTSQLEELGILGLSDIVLNHTGSDSPWLADHLDAGYSPTTAPHLQVALALDTELLKFRGSIASDADLGVIAPAVDAAAEAVKLWEFYVINAAAAAKGAETAGEAKGDDVPSGLSDTDLSGVAAALRAEIGTANDHLGGRFHRRVDAARLAAFSRASRFSAQQIVDELNVALYAEYNADLGAAKASIVDRQRYLRLDGNGPRVGAAVDEANPLIESYFNRRFGEPLACNGWVWGGNPLIDHAGPECKAYIRRELIVWGDCTKLRYGACPQDSPYVWDRMGRYARLLARHFAGLRLDNAHSTPVHVGEYILAEARRVRPNVYVVAELFSGSQEMDKLYIEKLGINSLLREAIMPGSPQDLSGLIHTNGGDAIGSLIPLRWHDTSENSTASCNIVTGSPSHSWLMEVTHDNETMAEKRTVEDTLSTAGLVAMAQVASGSVFGSDEAYGEALNVVSETRPYTTGGGMVDAKRVLNALHQEMAAAGMHDSYTELRGQYITVHRLNPETGKGVFLVARTKFWDAGHEEIGEIVLDASHANWGNGWSLARTGDASPTPEKIGQIPTELRELSAIEAADISTDGGAAPGTKIHISAADFPQGSVAFWRTERTFDVGEIEKLVRESGSPAVADLSLVELNALLYRAEGEERAASDWKRGTYSVPDYGALVYAGLQGFETPLRSIVADQNLGHPLCANLRAGLWALDFLVAREGDNSKAGAWLRARRDAIEKLPSFLRPRYFAATVLTLYSAATDRALALMGLDGSQTSVFYRRLALTSVQMIADLPNTSLSPLEHTPTMAAGLPFFSEGVMRCWGRDVFLSVGGLLTRLGRLTEARQHILGFGATLKYGLIPNLLDGGRNPRYNARDAAWFFVQSVQEYCERSGSLELLDDKVRRRFPLDDSYTAQTTDVWSTVGELVFEVLARHAGGIKFREHDAGAKIDMHMKSAGFDQHIYTDWKTGFVFGGSQDNCGTWQDKMGESPQAGSEGVPGTPRDGAAVEITALLKSCLRWVNATTKAGKYQFPKTVKNENGEDVTLVHWEELIAANFERCYYIPEGESQSGSSDSAADVNWKVVNRRGIYKDLYRSGKEYEDYQFRPNFTVGVVAAPELFAADKVQRTLDLADSVLRGPVGMATLDPSDWNYRPNYVNGVESSDFATSRGRNYHQGPEWLWLYGTFLEACVATQRRLRRPESEIRAYVRERVQGHVRWIADSPWAGLTELTNQHGAFCADASPTQAWSAARLIEAINEATSEVN